MLAKAPVERDLYGIEMDRYERIAHTITSGDTFGSFWQKYGVPARKLQRIYTLAPPVMDFSKVRLGQEFFAYVDTTSGQPSAFVYASDAESYVTFDLRDSVQVFRGYFETSLAQQTHTALLGPSESLYSVLDSLPRGNELARQFARIFASQVDFGRLNEGDQFALVYEEGRIHDEVTHVKVVAARLQHGGKDLYSYGIEQPDGSLGFYDENGASLRRAFLLAPLEYTRISSRFSNRRYHPVLKRYRPHLGTDFAAPYGTPILATAAGTVTAVGYDGGNGHYVKIRHDGVYSTMYLHMNRRPPVKRGQRVAQGEVIGAVGSTGLATGPHVCYRLTMNGKAVDPFNHVSPPAPPIPDEDFEEFVALRDQFAPSLTF